MDWGLPGYRARLHAPSQPPAARVFSGDTAPAGEARLERDHVLAALLQVPSSDNPASSPSLSSLSDSQRASVVGRFGEHVLTELRSLSQENDPEMFRENLLAFGVRQEQAGHLELAARVYAAVPGDANHSVAADTGARAHERLDAILGQGSIGPRAEFLLRRLAQESCEPTSLLAMGGAGALFKVTRLGLLSRLAASPTANIFTRGFGARAIASLAAFSLEAPAFTLTGHLANSAIGRNQDWSHLGNEIASSYLVLGGMRLTGWAANSLGSGLLLNQTGMLGGILLGHRLEAGFGLIERRDGATTLIDSLALLLQFNVAGNLSRHAFGERFHAWEQGLELQTEILNRETGSQGRPGSIGSGAIPLAENLRPATASLGEFSGETPGSRFPDFTILAMSASGRRRGGRRDRVPQTAATREVSSSPPIDPARLRALPRGGVMVQTSSGWIQLGVPMWTNKDALDIFQAAGGRQLSPERIPHVIPTVYLFDPQYVADHDGLLPADFMQYMFFINRGQGCTLIAPDRSTAARLEEFLNLTYQGPEGRELSEQVRREYLGTGIGLPELGEETRRGFSSPTSETLRRVDALDESGEFVWQNVRIRRLAPLRYEIHDSDHRLGTVDLSQYPLPQPVMTRDMNVSARPELQNAREKVLYDGRPALWPIGTGHGFSSKEETSGFMLWNRGRVVLVDPPSSSLEYMNAHGLPLETVEGILLTHGHTDHYGNAIPQLLGVLPRAKLYTTPTIFRMLQRQYELALGVSDEGPRQWNFTPLYPQQFTEVNGLHLRADYSFHPVPAIGFEIYDIPDVQRGRLALAFTGDTFADHALLWRHTQAGPNQEPPLMSGERALQILRHGALLLASKQQSPPPIFLIEGGLPPIHTPPLRTRELLHSAAALGVDTSRVRVYHIANQDAAEAGVPKWLAGYEGFFDLSDYFPQFRPRGILDFAEQGLSRLPQFRSLSEASRRALLSEGTLEQVAAGTTLMREQSADDGTYLLLDGEVELSHGENSLGRHGSGLLGVGAALGELSEATAITTVPSLLLKWNSRAFAERLEAEGMLQALAQARSVRALSRESLSRTFLGKLPETVLESLFQIGRIEVYGRNSILIREGDSSRDVFVLLDGSVRITNETRSIDAHEGNGAVLGELALLRRRPRAATVRAERATRVLRLPADKLEALMANYPGIGMALRKTASSRGDGR